MNNWTIKKIESWTHSWKTGSSPRPKSTWQLIDPEGIARDSFSRKKDALASAARLNRPPVLS